MGNDDRADRIHFSGATSDRLASAPSNWDGDGGRIVTSSDVARPARIFFKAVKSHHITATYDEVWESQRGELLATWTYAQCVCGDRFVVQQSGPLTEDETGWATDELAEAEAHLGSIYASRIYHARKHERNKRTVVTT